MLTAATLTQEKSRVSEDTDPLRRSSPPLSSCEADRNNEARARASRRALALNSDALWARRGPSGMVFLRRRVPSDRSTWTNRSWPVYWSTRSACCWRDMFLYTFNMVYSIRLKACFKKHSPDSIVSYVITEQYNYSTRHFKTT